MTRPFLPGALLGVMGGGQLGRMFAIVARTMGYRVRVFTPDEDSPAGQIADEAIVADYENEGAVRRFARDLDLLTFEFENIPAETVKWCAHHCEIVRPVGAILHTVQNRLREKFFLAEAGIPVAPFREVDSLSELSSAIEHIGRPAILKSAAFGYDGKGQQMISSREAEEIWEARSGDELILERAIKFAKEISVIVARGPDGAMATFPVCENIHRNHILDVTVAPARIKAAAEREAAELAKTIAEKLELVGLLAVEMFLEGNGNLIVNELAPRPHNSGHWTIEGCVTSQFEQQLRAVCGLPLGSTDMLSPSAMANLLGDLWKDGEPDWNAALAIPGVHLHLYGKHEPRPRRKMGHLTAVAGSADEAFALVVQARERLTGARK